MTQSNRRQFIRTAGAGAAALAVQSRASAAPAGERPNILWITSEDNGPHLGCYGDEYATTPNLDGLAAKGVIYRSAWSTAPVCAPARTTIISGMYPPCLGAEHMRCMIPLPEGIKMFPEYLRAAGYYCTNNSKEDYNLEKPDGVWDESSNKAHWRNRKEGQPFFAVFNFTTTHESQIRRRPHEWKHDPDKVRVPAYHPDTPEVRKDWAQYYDKLTEMDAQAGEVMRQLEEDGLADNTIIFYYGDHGPGMPRGKRWTYNSGLRVPMIVHIPDKWKHLAPPDYETGGESDRLVGFIDLAPTVLSLAGAEPPEHMQGRAFLGEYAQPKPDCLFGFRGRMDERYDMVRSVRNQRYIYIRNYMPHKIYGQHINYMFQTPTTQVWHGMYEEGELEPPQTYFWQTKPAEELYDLENDPDEVNNLALSPAHQEVMNELRAAQQDWVLRIRDMGFLPEYEIHERANGGAPYEAGQDPDRYPVERIVMMAELAASEGFQSYSPRDRAAKAVFGRVLHGFSASDSAERYWAAMGVLMRGKHAVEDAAGLLRGALDDEAPGVKIIAAQALGQFGTDDDAKAALDVLLEYGDLQRHGVYIAMLALNALDAMGERANPAAEAIKNLPSEDPDNIHPRLRSYVPRLLEDLNARLG